ncbi:hypothetical protein ACIQYL_25410 [Lysinibacillus xylanilyticus]|uniref:hypothetical protein n=1 Tax=Lysinibacillus xylanilyticus TaxID=582475 RepID=UPI00381EAA51
MSLKEEINALQLFVKDGLYAEKQECKNNIEQAKELLRDQLHSTAKRRHEFKDLEWVAKFQLSEIRVTDQPGFINKILNYVRSEALSQVITLDSKLIESNKMHAKVADFKYKPTFYSKINLNKFGKSFNCTLGEDFTGLSPDELVRVIVSNSERQKTLESMYGQLMAPFKYMDDKRISLDIGSISKIPNKPIWDIYSMVNELGEEFIKKYGKVKLTVVDDWIQLGVLPKNIRSEYQQVIDIRLDFAVMSLEAERKALEAQKISFDLNKDHLKTGALLGGY